MTDPIPRRVRPLRRFRAWCMGRGLFSVAEAASHIRRRRTESLTMRDVSIHYKFVFDVGRSINLAEAAQRLLSTDLGVTAVTQSDTWDAERFAELRDLRRQYEKAQEAGEHLTRGLGPWARYLARRPSLLRTYWRAWRGGVSNARVEGEQTRQPNFGEIDRHMAQLSKLQALFRDVDAEIFNPDFIQRDPWLRVELQPCFGKSGEKDYGIDVGLLLHRSGTAVLTFYVMHDGPLNTAELSRRSIASHLHFHETEVASWIAEAAAASHEGWEVQEPRAERFDSGIQWSQWEHADAASLTDVFWMYLEATRSALHARQPSSPQPGDAKCYSPQWFSYPVVCVRRPDPRCFDRDDVDAQVQVGALVDRLVESKQFRPSYLLAEADHDVSITDSRCWVHGGYSLLLVSDAEQARMAARRGGYDDIPGQDWIWREQQLAAPLDFLLLEYHTAVALNAQAITTHLDSRSFHALKARVFAAKSDLSAPSRFTYATVNSIKTAFHQFRGTAQAWLLLDESLRLVESVLEAEERRAAARRSTSLEAVLAIIAVVLGRPGRP